MSRLGRFILLFLPCGPTSNDQPGDTEVPTLSQGLALDLLTLLGFQASDDLICSHAAAKAWWWQPIATWAIRSSCAPFSTRREAVSGFLMLQFFNRTSPNCWSLLWIKGNNQSIYNPQWLMELREEDTSPKSFIWSKVKKSHNFSFNQVFV